MIKYELAKIEDAESIKTLYKQAEWLNCSCSVTSCKDISTEYIINLIKGSYLFLLAKDKNNVIGIARVISDGVSDAYIQDVVVSKEYRGQNIGSNLVKELIKILLERNINWIVLIAKPELKNFYTKLGFKHLLDHNLFIYE